MHGYDTTSIACIGGGGADENPRHRFVSGADEKFLRVFDAPASTLRLLDSLRRLKQLKKGSSINGGVGDPSSSNSGGNGIENHNRVERAFLPSL